MEQPRNESVTKICNGKQELIGENLTFGEALGIVWRLRQFMNHFMESDLAPKHRTYYRLGRPH